MKKSIILYGLLLIALAFSEPNPQTETIKPVNVGIIPLLSINGANSFNTTNNFTFNLLYGSSRNLRGYAYGLIGHNVYNKTVGFLNGGLFTYSKEELIGFQSTSLLNIANNLKGVQMALVNITDTVRGVQIGLVNIAKDIKGPPIGLINVIKNGRIRAELWYEMSMINTSFQFGSNYFHSLLFIGFGDNPGVQYNGGGYGFKLPLPKKTFIQGDFIIGAYMSDADFLEDDGTIETGVTGRLIKHRFGFGYQFMKYLAAKLGFSILSYSGGRKLDSPRIPADFDTEYTGISFFGGLQF
jgi:hypothetical protein